MQKIFQLLAYQRLASMILSMKLIVFLLLCISVAAAPSQKAVRDRVNKEIPSLIKLYQHLHANPEISFQEAKTGQRRCDNVETVIGVAAKALRMRQRFDDVEELGNRAGPAMHQQQGQ